MAHLESEWAGVLGDEEIEEVGEEGEEAVAEDDHVEAWARCSEGVDGGEAVGLENDSGDDEPDGRHGGHVQQEAEAVESF